MPSFLDQFQPSLPGIAQAAPASPVLTALTTLDPVQRNIRNTIRTAREQVVHFTEWNYVSIDWLAWRFSQLCPYFGSVSAPRTRQRFSVSERQHLRQHYPRVVRQAMAYGHDTPEPLEASHPIVQLFENVNQIDWYQAFAYELMMWLELTGRCYIWMTNSALPSRNGRGYIPAEMHIVPTTWIEPYVDKPGMPQTGWVITPEGDYTKRQIVDLEDVEFLRYKSPLSKWDGFSPLQGGSRWTENAESIEMSRQMQFRNGGNPDVLVELDGEVHSNPSREVIDRIKEMVMQRTSGLRRTGEPLISPPGMKYSKWSNTPREMDYETSATQARDAVLALRGTPKVLFGITEDVNRASIEGANIIAGQNLDPKAAYIAGFFQERILSRFGTGYCMWFNSAVPMDAAEKRAEQQFQFACGALSPDEIRIAAGMQPFESPASQSGYLPSGLMPLDPEAMPEPPADEPGADTGEDPPEDLADDEDTDPQEDA